jgi:hypothetical protein
MRSLNRRSLLKFGLVFVAAVIAMELFGRFIEARDTVLPGAERFMRAAPQVHSAVGEIKNASLKKSLYYEGVPDRAAPYREYSFGVSGTKSQAFVVIRAEQQNEQYSYRVVRVEQ